MKTIPPVGSRIKHRTYGEGTVIANTDGAQGFDIRIRFDKHGVKEFVWMFAEKNIRVLKRAQIIIPTNPRRADRDAVWLMRYIADNAGCFRTDDQVRRLRKIANRLYQGNP